ncbi:MAG: hypothetical protein FJ392_04725 [Verrucomicrobia bacterium]|nr:hypothetical protein [Verrucomicrobiota bacterium]
MKSFFALVCASLLLAAPVASAQNAAGIPAINSQAPFLAAALSEFFSDTRAFTAGVEMTLPAPGGGDGMKLPFGVAMADGKMRWELNLANVKSVELPPEAVASIREMGLDRMFFIFLPGKPLTLVLPGMKSYVEMPMPKPEGIQQQAAEKIGRLEKKELGRETVAGQPAVKYAVQIPGDDGTAIVWQATNLQNLPVKIVITKDKQTYQLQLSNIKLGQPAAAYFALPVGFVKQADLNAVIQAAAMKAFSSGVGGLK